MLLQGTHFETGFDHNANFTAVMFLGCGFVVLHNADIIASSMEAGYKLHSIAGRKVGFAIFTKQV